MQQQLCVAAHQSIFQNCLLKGAQDSQKHKSMMYMLCAQADAAHGLMCSSQGRAANNSA
jgi:hypothetical protein